MKIFCFCYACHPASSSCFIYQFGCTWPCLFHLENLLVQKQQLGTHPAHSPEQDSQMTQKVCPSVCFAYCLSKKRGGNSMRFTSPHQERCRRKSLWVLSSLPLLFCGSLWPDHPVSFLPAVLTLMENKLIWGKKPPWRSKENVTHCTNFCLVNENVKWKSSSVMGWCQALSLFSLPHSLQCPWGDLGSSLPSQARQCGNPKELCLHTPAPPSHCCQMFTRCPFSLPSGTGIHLNSLQLRSRESLLYPNTPKLLRRAGLALCSALVL